MATRRQELAVQIYLGNPGISKSEAMRRAGYAENTIKNPKDLTESPAWKELLEQHLSDKKLVNKHKELLEATKLESATFPNFVPKDMIREILLEAGCKPRNYEMNPKTGITHVWYWAPDRKAQASALDLAYKLKGRLTQKVEHSGNIPVAMVEFLGDEGSDSGQDPVS